VTATPREHGAAADAPAGASAAPVSARAVEAVWRIESARIVATLTRFTRDFGLAEDLAQEALAEALAAWPRTGVPANPGAWLVAVGKRRAIDTWRREAARSEKYAELPRSIRMPQPGHPHPGTPTRSTTTSCASSSSPATRCSRARPRSR
jgi:DNA-directed RNA polymerase specialized sigma24 family protein